MKNYKMNNKAAFIISVILAAIISAPIIADSIKRAPLPPISLFILDTILFIGFYILFYNYIRSIIVKY